MLKFDLIDLGTEGLKKLARFYGAPCDNRSDDELRQAIRAVMPKSAEIVTGLSEPSPVRTLFRRQSTWALIIAGVAMVAAWASAISAANNAATAADNATTAARSLDHLVNKNLADARNEKVRSWQRVAVFSILNREDKGDFNTNVMTFDEIKDKYIAEATVVEGIDLKKEELQPLVLKSILLDLIMGNAVYRTIDDRYTVQRAAVNLRADRVLLEQQAKYAILHTLSTEGGKYTMLELGQVITDRMKITNEEFNVLLNELIAVNAVVIDDGSKLWSASNSPRKKKS